MNYDFRVRSAKEIKLTKTRGSYTEVVQCLQVEFLKIKWKKPSHSLDHMNFNFILIVLIMIMYSVQLFQQYKIPGIFWFYFLQIGFGFVVRVFVN